MLTVMVAILIFLLSAFIVHRMRGAEAAKGWAIDAIIGAIATVFTGGFYFLVYLFVVIPQQEHSAAFNALNENNALRTDLQQIQTQRDKLKHDYETAITKLDTLSIAAGVSPTGGLNEKLDRFLSDFDATKNILRELESRTPPPARHLTQEQRKKFIEALTALGKGSIAVRTARSKEAQDYGDELAVAFKEAGWEVREPVFLFITKEGLGTKIAVNDEKEPPTDAIKVAKAFVFSGIVQKPPVNSFVFPGLKKEQAELYIGFPEE